MSKQKRKTNLSPEQLALLNKFKNNNTNDTSSPVGDKSIVSKQKSDNTPPPSVRRSGSRGK